jgi:HNH endonuclease
VVSPPNQMILLPPKKYEVDEATGCWLWKGKLNKGYGTYLGQPAHRWVYEQQHGPLPPWPERPEVHHTCENKACVNPEHLEALTTAEHRGRHINPGRKLTTEQAREIRYAPPDVPHLRLSRRFGVGPESIRAIREGRIYKDAA